MSDTVLAALIGMVGAVLTSLIGAYVAVHTANQNRKHESVAAGGNPRLKMGLAATVAVGGLLLVGGFAVATLQGLTVPVTPLPAPAPTPPPDQPANVPLSPTTPPAATATALPLPPTVTPDVAAPPTMAPATAAPATPLPATPVACLSRHQVDDLKKAPDTAAAISQAQTLAPGAIPFQSGDTIPNGALVAADFHGLDLKKLGISTINAKNAEAGPALYTISRAMTATGDGLYWCIEK